MNKIFILAVCFFCISAQASQTCKLNVDKKSVELKWTGYKFTSKTAVSGTFKEIDWSVKPGETMAQLLSSLKFNINTESVNSGNRVRDSRLFKNFFKLMNNGKAIAGKGLKFKTKKGEIALIEINMNGKNVPVEFKIKQGEGKSFELTGSIDMLKHFSMMSSFKSIAEKCKALHTGEDGVSKTWSDVALKISGKLLKECK